MDFLQWVPLLSALGAGGAIVGWVGAGKARRELRSAVLQAVTVVETERWAHDPDSADYPKFVAAVHELETAALVARIPREAVRHYVVLAEAARQLSDEAVDFDPGDETFWGGIDGYFNTLVRDATEVLIKLAWNPWRQRATLPWDLEKLRDRALKFDDSRIVWRLAGAQKAHGVLPGPLGQLPGIEDPPATVEPTPEDPAASAAHPNENTWISNSAAIIAAIVGLAITMIAADTLDRQTFVAISAVIVAMVYGVYFGFAIKGGTARNLVTEGVFIVVGLATAVLALKLGPVWLAVGLVLHGVWDILHHPRRVLVGTQGVPRWYVPFCAVYDITAAVAIIVIL